MFMEPQKPSRLFVLLIVLPFAIFSTLAIAVYQQGTGFLWDVPILQFIHATSLPEWQSFVGALTRLGSFRGICSLMVVTGLGLLALQYRQLLLPGRAKQSLLYLTLTILSSGLLNRAAKLLIQRERPHLWNTPFPELDYAFPSGHAMLSMTLFVVLVRLTWGSRWVSLVLFLGGLFVVAIAWTRLYLGVHYPSDIVAGWMLGLAWSMGMGRLLLAHSRITAPSDSNGIVNT
jgi:undecaprenyl-diphosphatase